MPDSTPIIRRAAFRRLTLGECIEVGDFWKSEWGFIRFDVVKHRWFRKVRVTKHHVPIYRITRITELS